MYYYNGKPYVKPGSVASIMCMGNPAVWWVGLGTLLYTIFRAAKNLWNRKTAADPAPALIVMGFAAQYLPWVLVPRSTFIYHYFASVPFIILATVAAIKTLEGRSRKAARVAAIVLLVCALVLFIAFYPLESGLPTLRAYAKYLRWFNWYNY